LINIECSRFSSSYASLSLQVAEPSLTRINVAYCKRVHQQAERSYPDVSKATVGFAFRDWRTCVEFYAAGLGLDHFGHFRLLQNIGVETVGPPKTGNCSSADDANIENTSDRNKLNVFSS